MASDIAWQRIFDELNLHEHDFDAAPAEITAEQIKNACRDVSRVADKEVRILCKQDRRRDRPRIFVDNNLFILPKHNGSYYIVKGEGYVDIPDIISGIQDYHSILDFPLQSSSVGDSEMQHVDFAYANSLIRTFMDDPSLVLTIRGRKYSPHFECRVNGFNLNISSIQTEVDAGYEGRNSVVLLEAKNSGTTDTIIRQIYFPFRQWSTHIPNKSVHTLFFEKRIINNDLIYYIWQFDFQDVNDYNSIRLIRSARYRIIQNNP